jgi:hypothetical protein
LGGLIAVSAANTQFEIVSGPGSGDPIPVILRRKSSNTLIVNWLARATPVSKAEWGKARVAPPPTVESLPRNIEDAKTVNGKPVDDPLGEAFQNFERALRERYS